MAVNYIQIITEQKAECAKILNEGNVLRTAESMISLDSNLAQIITGIRRSGKSTLAHRVLKNRNYAYLNFDDERLINLQPHELNDILESLYVVYGEFDYLLMDEVQNVEQWHLFVNRLLRNNIKIILTGSNSKLLSKEMATHLTGRYMLVELFTFSFREYLKAMNYSGFSYVTAKEKGILQNHFNAYLSGGGFPEIVGGEAQLPYITALFEGITTRDIVFRYQIRYVKTLRDIALYLLDNYGNKISFNRIKKLFGLGSENTAKNYVSYLEEAWLTATLCKFSYKKQESLRYRKIYLVDTAFAALSSNYSANTGRLLENIVFLQLKRFAIYQNYEVYFYKKNYEVDFLIYRNRKVEELIQVSIGLLDESLRKRELRALLLASEELGTDKLTVITMNEEEERISDNKIIKVVPVIKWLFEFENDNR